LDIKYQGIIWVGINVENLEVAINFYEKTLGLTLVRATDDAAHFDVGSGALLELFSGGKSSHGPKGADKQSSIVALGVGNLTKAVEILKRRGVLFIEIGGPPDNLSWATFTDSEGNRIEVKQIADA
jgi:predicted enzyme related to lactoylglutathione lyase